MVSKPSWKEKQDRENSVEFVTIHQGGTVLTLTYLSGATETRMFASRDSLYDFLLKGGLTWEG